MKKLVAFLLVFLSVFLLGPMEQEVPIKQNILFRKGKTYKEGCVLLVDREYDGGLLHCPMINMVGLIKFPFFRISYLDNSFRKNGFTLEIGHQQGGQIGLTVNHHCYDFAFGAKIPTKPFGIYNLAIFKCSYNKFFIIQFAPDIDDHTTWQFLKIPT